MSVEAGRDECKHLIRVVEEAGPLGRPRLVAPWVCEERVREMRVDGARQTERVRRLESGVHHAVDHENVRVEVVCCSATITVPLNFDANDRTTLSVCVVDISSPSSPTRV